MIVFHRTRKRQQKRTVNDTKLTTETETGWIWYWSTRAWCGHSGGLLATSFGVVFALRYHGNDYLYDVGDVGIRLGTARVVPDVAGGVKVYQRPLAVRNVVRRVSIFSHLKHVRFGPQLDTGRFFEMQFNRTQSFCDQLNPRKFLPDPTQHIIDTQQLNKCSAVAEMGDRLVTIDMGRKLGAVPLMGEGAWVPI